MLIRANVYCTLISSPRQVKAVASYGSGLIQHHSSCSPSQRVSVKALKDETGDETSVFRGQRWDPGLEIEVPFEQRPVVCLSYRRTSIHLSKMKSCIHGANRGPENFSFALGVCGC